MINTAKWQETEIGRIPEEWGLVKIGDLFFVKNGKTNTQDAVTNGKYPLFDRSTQIKSSNKYLFDSEAIIMPGEGKEFVPHYFSGKFDLHQRVYAITPKTKKICVKFFYYWMYYYRNYLSRIAVGSTVKSLRLGHLISFPAPNPTLTEQETITKTLSDLDSKIELNNQMNATLEAMAQAIFKHWFIDFEFPDENGKPYKSSGGKMVDSELGEIPEGWEVGKIGEITKYIRDQVLPYQNTNKNYNHYSIEAYDIGMRPISQLGAEILSNKFIVHNNTILVSKLNPRIRRIWPVIIVKENGICSTEFLVFKPNDIEFCYFYGLISTNILWENLIQKARGTSSSHQRISADDILNILVPIPPQNILKSYEKVLLPYLVKRENNISVQTILQQTRDSLLPKLMSGQIRVPVEVAK